MIVVGLTGGIGSGKTALAALLSERGAHVIDADQLGRDALHPGEPAWHSVVSQFGDEILTPAMEIDRKRLAALVFSDPGKLAALNAIVHPVIMEGIADALERYAGTDDVVVLDAALIIELGLQSAVDLLVAVVAAEGTRTKRLVEQRDMTAEDVIARMNVQAPTEEIAARAEVVVKNEGTLEDLAAEADRLWAIIQERR